MEPREEVAVLLLPLISMLQLVKSLHVLDLISFILYNSKVGLGQGEDIHIATWAGQVTKVKVYVTAYHSITTYLPYIHRNNC